MVDLQFKVQDLVSGVSDSSVVVQIGDLALVQIADALERIAAALEAEVDG